MPDDIRRPKGDPTGTHQGQCSPELRARRAAKAQRSERRDRSTGETKRGSHRWDTRLWLIGNAAKRGVDYR